MKPYLSLCFMRPSLCRRNVHPFVFHINLDLTFYLMPVSTVRRCFLMLPSMKLRTSINAFSRKVHKYKILILNHNQVVACNYRNMYLLRSFSVFSLHELKIKLFSVGRVYLLTFSISYNVNSVILGGGLA